jgi:hypothetical protein
LTFFSWDAFKRRVYKLGFAMPLKIKLSTINDENVVLELLGLLTISKDQFYVDL